MNQKAQSSLEYLMTYGWALVLIATVVSVLVFIISSPASGVTFSSSDPTKIMVKAGAIQGTNAVAQLTNITGGRMAVTVIAAAGTSYTLPCTINKEASNIDIPAGSVMELNCPLSGEDPTGAVTISYTDFAGLERDVVIRIASGIAGETGGQTALMEPYCIDQYEASRSDATYCDNSTTWSGGCSASYGSSNVAASVAGRIPWVMTVQSTAANACAAAGKRLCSSSEWLAAANLNGQVYNLDNTTTANTCVVDSTLYCSNHSFGSGEACNTGSNSNCKSDAGVYDMIGNVWEWTSDSLDVNSDSLDNAWNYPNDEVSPRLWGNTTPSLHYGNDGVYTGATKTNRIVGRGGNWYSGSSAGVFSTYLLQGTTGLFQQGFRCCDEPTEGNECGSGMVLITPTAQTMAFLEDVNFLVSLD